MKNFRFGLLAEYIIMVLYKLSFYKILSHRMKNYSGEVDIVAVRGKNIVFIEVKARSNIMYDSIISYKQQCRIKRSAEFFLAKNRKYNSYNVRFDLAIVRPYKFPKIIKNAW